MQQIHHAGEGAVGRQGKPVSQGLPVGGQLALEVLGHLRKGVALGVSRAVFDVFIPAGEGHGLEGDGLNLVDVASRKIDDGSDSPVVDAVDDGGHQSGFHADFGHVLDGLQLDVEQIADAAVTVALFAGAVELQVGPVKSRFMGLPGELLALGEANPVGGRQNPIESDLLGVGDGFDEEWGEGGFSSGEEDDHLATRLVGDGAVQNGLDVFKLRLMNIANLIGIHEAGIAHHVASVGQIHRQHSAASELDAGVPMAMDVVIFGATEIPPEEEAFDSTGKFGVGGEHIFERPVLVAHLPHDHLTALFQNLGLDFTRVPGHQGGEVGFAVNDGIADLGHAARTQGIGDPGESQGGSRAFVALEHLAGSPAGRRELSLREASIDGLEGLPGQIGYTGEKRRTRKLVPPASVPTLSKHVVCVHQCLRD